MFDLRTRDWRVIGLLLTGWIAATGISGYVDILRFGLGVEVLFNALTVVASLVTLYYMVPAIQSRRRKMRRFLVVIGAGLGYFVLSLGPHAWMHTNYPEAASYFVFQHVSTFWAFLLIAYGFYLLTSVGRDIDVDSYHWKIVAVGALTSLLAGFYASRQPVAFAYRVEFWTAAFNIPLFLVSLYFVTRFVDMWGGVVGRGLQIVGIGTVLQMAMYGAHIMWHSAGFPQSYVTPFGGITASIWLGFFHTAGTVAMLIIAYGFYILGNSS
ncbi:MAG: hypothetical protein SVU32_03465 [Candidatus Nanohaloarchaea archaeon]|nr:hypothetical protein [Candidatus Nanohaloarchaea archaeon]